MIVLLTYLTILLYHAGIESVGYGGRIVRILEGIVICLYLGLSDTVAIEVGRRLGDYVERAVLIDALGHDLRIEDDRHQCLHQFIAGLTLEQRATIVGDSVHRLSEECLGKFRSELIGRIMMVDTVAEPYLLQILLESLEVGRCAVAGISGIDIFEQTADLQIVAAVLIPYYVAAGLSGLREIIKHLLLLKRKRVKLRHFISEHLDVGEIVDMIIEILVFRSHGGE